VAERRGSYCMQIKIESREDLDSICVLLIEYKMKVRKMLDKKSKGSYN
jgi:hypothetical protein